MSDADDETHESSTQMQGRVRRRTRQSVDGARDRLSDAAQRDDAVGAAARGTRGAGQKTQAGLKRFGRFVDKQLARGTEKLTLSDYRREVDAALAEALDVVAVQQATIEALERRVEELEASP